MHWRTGVDVSQRQQNIKASAPHHSPRGGFCFHREAAVFLLSASEKIQPLHVDRWAWAGYYGIRVSRYVQ